MSALESLAVALLAVVMALTARGCIESTQPTYYHLTGGARDAFLLPNPNANVPALRS